MEEPYPNACYCCASSELPLSSLSQDVFEFLIWFVGFDLYHECRICGLCEKKLRACMQFRVLIFQSHSKIGDEIKEGNPSEAGKVLLLIIYI
jgi:hypothetical protein